MSLEVKIHEAQTKILRALLFSPSAGYAVLQKPTELTSDHFNFHIGRLIELNLVEKVSRGHYQLTSTGKEYANRLDTDNNSIERQPKVTLILGLARESNGETQYIFQQRLKNPYYGFWGLPTGKLRWSETIIQAAARETLEETGLHAEFSVKNVYHEHIVEKEGGQILEDKIFFIVLGEHVHGKLMADFEGGHNEWLSVTSVMKQDKKYDTLEMEVALLGDNKVSWLVEQTVAYSKQEF